MPDVDGIKEAKMFYTRYAAKDRGVFPQRFEFPGLGDEKQAGADI